jgi:hypothetical protein
VGERLALCVSFCKMREIYVVFQMEINANGRRVITTSVDSIWIVL